jgi:Ca2+-binding RTX toxin-like protein
MVETFLSAPRPRALSLNQPAEAAGGVLFSGSFAVGASGGSGRTLGSRTYVEINDRCTSQKTLIEARDIVAVETEVVDAEINVEASRYTFTKGRQYAFRLIVENGRGLAGASETQSFVYDGPDATSDPCGEENLPLEQVGTAGADTLEGTEGPDLLRGLAGEDFLSGADGDDTLLGNADADILNGGPGLDEIAGGSGRDRINALDGRGERVRCGKGKDRARLDPDDEAIGCERDY